MFTHRVPAGFQSATMPRTPATSEGVAVVPQVFSVSPQSWPEPQFAEWLQRVPG